MKCISMHLEKSLQLAKVFSMKSFFKNRFFHLISLTLFLVSAMIWSADAQENRSSIIDGELNSHHRATIVDHNGKILAEDEVDREAIHVDDSLALVAFYHSMNGDQWLDNAGWLELPVDFWVGVDRVENIGTEENPDWRVTRIETKRYNLTVPGHMPPEMGLMTELQRFRVQDELMIGEIPAEVANMTRLERWQHNGVYMSGEIPWEAFRDLPNLSFWNMQHGLFHGTGIPDFIDEFPVLTRFDIRDNRTLSGTIPSSVANAEYLERLRIGQNNISGDLPDLSNLEYLQRIQISHLPLDPGPIWDWLPNVQESLEELYIDHTNRTGDIPDWLPRELTNLTDLSIGEGYREHPEDPLGMDGADIPNMLELVDLERLWIYGPAFTGEIPTWLGEMLSFERLYVVNTNFEGEIPGELAFLNNLEVIEFYNNHYITGGLPDEFADLGTVTHFTFQNNSRMEIGQIPDWISDLTSISVLNLSGSGVTGTLPDLTGMTNISVFNVSDNPGLTGDLPAQPFEDAPWTISGVGEVYSAERVSNSQGTFNISRTGLNVNEIPEWLNSTTVHRGMVELGFAGLGIEGEIPSWLGEIVWLERLALDDNAFTGPIPDEFVNLSRMDSLNLANNQLSGELPGNFENIGRLGNDVMVLQHLILSGNENLIGEVPIGLTDADRMRHFMIDGTQLCTSSGMDKWLESISENGLFYFPWRYTGVNANEEFCDELVSAEPIDERAYIFQLGQNYPNPFNPATTIDYEVPMEGHVTLHLYNVLGQRVATLVNDTQSAGRHQVNLDATRLASGSYIYRLVAGDRSLTRTMMLIK